MHNFLNVILKYELHVIMKNMWFDLKYLYFKGKNTGGKDC